MVLQAFTGVGEFREGLAPVRVEKKWGFIDKTGNMVEVPTCQWLRPLAEGLSAYRQEGKWGYVDAKGQPVIPARFAQAEDFSQGLALVLLPGVRPDFRDGKYAFINRAGEIVISLETTGEARAEKKDFFSYFDMGGPDYKFTDGLVPVEKNGKFGFVDQTGKLVIPATFGKARNFAEGLAPVGVGHKQGYIDKTGRFVWQTDN